MHEEMPEGVVRGIDEGATEIGANAAASLPETIVGVAVALAGILA